jgi:hypothetical protein
MYNIVIVTKKTVVVTRVRFRRERCASFNQAFSFHHANKEIEIISLEFPWNFFTKKEKRERERERESESERES